MCSNCCCLQTKTFAACYAAALFVDVDVVVVEPRVVYTTQNRFFFFTPNQSVESTQFPGTTFPDAGRFTQTDTNTDASSSEKFLPLRALELFVNFSHGIFFARCGVVVDSCTSFYLQANRLSGKFQHLDRESFKIFKTFPGRFRGRDTLSLQVLELFQTGSLTHTQLRAQLSARPPLHTLPPGTAAKSGGQRTHSNSGKKKCRKKNWIWSAPSSSSSLYH